MIELARRYGCYGYRRFAALLRDAGWQVNHKRVERPWRREGLKVPSIQPKRGRLWLNDGSCKGCTLPQLALAWILNKQAKVVPIQGADRVPFVEENVAAAEIELTAVEIIRLEAANPPGIAAGERYPDEWMDEINR